MRYDEHNVQVACFNWLSMAHPNINAFAVPNGAKRSARMGAWYKAEGLKSGVADIIILKASGGYHGLCIEMKTKRGQQQPSQKDFQERCLNDGYLYKICRSTEDFILIVNEYLKENGNK